MGVTLEQIVPWGRSLSEYTRMFDLTEAELQGEILDCGGGPASFNAEMTQQGYSVISCDPVYQFSGTEIARRIQETYDPLLQQVQVYKDKYVWQSIRSPEQLGQVRMAAMQQFLDDFPLGLQQNRYQVHELPVLPLASGQFNLALCSHFLFTYSDHLSLEFHLDSIREMCRVAAEVRIFPLLTLAGERSTYLHPVVQALEAQSYNVQIKSVPYEFQKNGDQMLRCSQPTLSGFSEPVQNVRSS